jgi:hypothetical protein
MGKYGTAAIRAKQFHQQGNLLLAGAWRRACEEVFPDAPESRRKGCPRGAFLGLCAAGLVRGVAPAESDDLVMGANATYAVTAAHLLAADPSLATEGPTKLWRRVMKELGLEPSKQPNGQMDVVLTLWTSGALSINDGA